jgi:putative membrane protein
MAIKNHNNHNHENNHPYTRFEKDSLILRDELAVDRTLLANERTLLAYLRSAVSLGIAGVSIMHFSNQFWYLVFGIACLPAAVAVAVVGVIRYRRMNAGIGCVRHLQDEDDLDLIVNDDID